MPSYCFNWCLSISLSSFMFSLYLQVFRCTRCVWSKFIHVVPFLFVRHETWKFVDRKRTFSSYSFPWRVIHDSCLLTQFNGEYIVVVRVKIVENGENNLTSPTFCLSLLRSLFSTRRETRNEGNEKDDENENCQRMNEDCEGGKEDMKKCFDTMFEERRKELNEPSYFFIIFPFLALFIRLICTF